MIPNDHIHKKVEAALDSLEGIKKAAPAPYLLTRINARLAANRVTAWETIAGFISRPAIVVPGLCLVLLVNVLVIVQNKSVNNSIATEQVVSSQVDEYSTTFVTIDTIENIEP